jgi:hypothetical protein
VRRIIAGISNLEVERHESTHAHCQPQNAGAGDPTDTSNQWQLVLVRDQTSWPSSNIADFDVVVVAAAAAHDRGS